jgi:hypothetical protein
VTDKKLRIIKLQQQIVIGTAINRALITLFDDDKKELRRFLAYLHDHLSDLLKELDALQNNS